MHVENRMKQGWQVGTQVTLSIGLALMPMGTSFALAQSQSEPPSELERLDYFAGMWSCTQPADSDTPSDKFTWKVERGLNDFWYLGNAQQDIVPDDGEPINSQEFLGYDVAQQKLVRSVVVGNGHFYNMSADDWQEDKLVWQGAIVMNGKSTPLKQEIVRDSQDKFYATYFVPGEEDNWIPAVDESCDRILSE